MQMSETLNLVEIQANAGRRAEIESQCFVILWKSQLEFLLD